MASISAKPSPRPLPALSGWLILVAGTAILIGIDLTNRFGHWLAAHPAWSAWVRAVIISLHGLIDLGVETLRDGWSAWSTGGLLIWPWIAIGLCGNLSLFFWKFSCSSKKQI